MGQKIVGIDLAGKEENPTGIAFFDGREMVTTTIHLDGEIIEACAGAALVAIDAPLSFPRKGALRKCDAALIKRGLRVLPPSFSGMFHLTRRGVALAKKLRRRGLKVIEIHPRTSAIILFGTDERKKWLKMMKKKGFRFCGVASDHEIDASIAALTGWLHLQKKTEKVGDRGETIVIPLHKPF
ncbi:MAG: DUF429 domain-containing protein [Candidatus Hadarchaeales archaeon]